MKGIVVIGVSLCLVSPLALAFSGVSPKFDGAYGGTVEPNRKMSHSAECESFPVDFTVTGGAIRGASAAAEMEGFVTEEGFIRGNLRRGQGKALLVEGRMAGATGEMVSAAMVDDAAGCAWSINMRKK